MDWEQPDWVRGLGWSLIFAALLALALGALVHDMPGWLAALAGIAAIATVVLPVVVGMCFPEDKWWWGPCLGMAIALVLLLVIPATDPAKQTALGMMTRKDEFIFLLVWGGWLFLIVLLLLYVGLAIVGIRIGRKREERQNWDGDAGFRNMLATNERTSDEAP